MKQISLFVVLFSCLQAFAQNGADPALTFFHARCLSPDFYENETRIQTRVVDSLFYNNTFSIKIEAMINCGFGEAGKMEYRNDSLFLWSMPDKTFEIDAKGDTLLLEPELACNCDFIINCEIAGMPSRPTVLVFNGERIDYSANKYYPEEYQVIHHRRYLKYDKLGFEYAYSFDNGGRLMEITKRKGALLISYHLNADGQITTVETKREKGKRIVQDE